MIGWGDLHDARSPKNATTGNAPGNQDKMIQAWRAPSSPLSYSHQTKAIGMIERLVGFIGRVGHWGYLIIFLGATLEASAFLGVFVPGESLVLIGGFLANRGQLDLGDLIALVAAGAVIGDSIGYELGRYLGRPWLLRYGRWAGLRPEHLDRVDRAVEKHGGKPVFFGRFVGFLRALVPFIAGASRMQYRQFLFYNALGGI